jgi:hypothetical protein
LLISINDAIGGFFTVFMARQGQSRSLY